MRPRTHYAKAGDISIAYQVTGDGPVDLVRVPGWVSNIDYDWAYPPQARLIERFSQFTRFIRFDKRGTDRRREPRGSRRLPSLTPDRNIRP